MASEDPRRGPAGSALAGRRVLLGVSGGIAAYKAAYLVRILVTAGANVRAVMTPGATHFVGPDTFAALTRHPVHTDVFERPEAVLHVRLAHQADVAVVAPATANILAKLALGLADDLLSSTLLEATCPLVVAPAMHTGMWEHPATRANVRTLRERGATIVRPGTGPLAAGDEGEGRMAEPEEIVRAVEDLLLGTAPAGVGDTRSGQDLAGVRVLVTAGPTREPIDPVRYLGNRSSGKMGFAIAAEASARGAAVTLVTGPVALDDPEGVDVVTVETTDEMATQVLSRFPKVDAVVMAAAVADFRPRQAATVKLKKASGPPHLGLEPTTDILAALGKRKEGQILIGFAAETEGLEGEALRKLSEKNLDLVVANEVGRSGTGFESDTNRAGIYMRGGQDEAPREWTKLELAAAICERLSGLIRRRG